MGRGQYSGLMVSQEGNVNLAYLRDACMGHGTVEITIKLEGYIKVGLTDALQNSLSALESDGNQQTDIPMCFFKIATGSMM